MAKLDSRASIAKRGLSQGKDELSSASVDRQTIPTAANASTAGRDLRQMETIKKCKVLMRGLSKAIKRYSYTTKEKTWKLCSNKGENPLQAFIKRRDHW